MKALIVEKPGVLKVSEIDIPETGEYDALCETLFGATCAGTDLHIIAGTFGVPIVYPTIIGHESIGRVIKIGCKVRHYRVGDLITRVGCPASRNGRLRSNWGGMAQYCVAQDHLAMKQDGLDRALWNAHRVNNVIPEGLIDPMDATMVITWRETYSYARRMGIGEGARVLVSGSGANGFSIARQSINLGAESVYFIGSAARAQTASALGIERYIDYKDQNIVAQFIAENLHSFDYIIDATGKTGSLNHLLPTIKNGGSIGVYGMDDYLSYNIMPLNAGCSFFFYNSGYDEEEAHTAVLELIRLGKLDASLWLDKGTIFTIENADAAYAYVKAKKAIKAVVRFKE